MNFLFFKSLQRLIALLTIALAGAVWAQIQESPLDTQILPVGRMFSLIIKGDGESTPPARISAEGLPPESVFLRNLDGSRTFIWIPDESDEGTSSFLVTIADGNDASLSATYPINLEVVAAAQPPGEELDVTDNQIDSRTAAPLTEGPAVDTPAPAEGTLDSGQLHTAEVVDINEAKTDAAMAPNAVDSTLDTSTVVDSTAAETGSVAAGGFSRSEVANKKAPVVDSALAAETTSTLDADALTSEPGNTNNAAIDTSHANTETITANPTLELPQGLTAVVNKELSIPIRHSSGSGKLSQLRAMNLPQGATLSDAPDGHILTWTPSSSDTGSTAIILIATDTENPSLSTTRRLGIEVLSQ